MSARRAVFLSLSLIGREDLGGLFFQRGGDGVEAIAGVVHLAELAGQQVRRERSASPVGQAGKFLGRFLRAKLKARGVFLEASSTSRRAGSP